MRTVQAVFDYPPKAERLQLLWRLLATLPIGFYLLVYSMAFMLAWPFVVVQMFFTRRRTTLWYEQVCKLVELWARTAAFFGLVSEEWKPRVVMLKISFASVPSRFELLFRPFFLILLFFNAAVLAIPVSIAWALQFLHILLLGKRHSLLHRLLVSYAGFLVCLKAYEYLATDERPPLLPPELSDIFKKSFEAYVED